MNCFSATQLISAGRYILLHGRHKRQLIVTLNICHFPEDLLGLYKAPLGVPCPLYKTELLYAPQAASKPWTDPSLSSLSAAADPEPLISNAEFKVFLSVEGFICVRSCHRSDIWKLSVSLWVHFAVFGFLLFNVRINIRTCAHFFKIARHCVAELFVMKMTYDFKIKHLVVCLAIILP